MSIGIALIVAIVGAIIYILGGMATHPAVVRFCDLGKYAFLAGMLAWLLK